MQTFFEALTEEGKANWRHVAVEIVGPSWAPVFSPPPRSKFKLEGQEEVDRIMRQPPASKKELKDGE